MNPSTLTFPRFGAGAVRRRTIHMAIFAAHTCRLNPASFDIFRLQKWRSDPSPKEVVGWRGMDLPASGIRYFFIIIRVECVLLKIPWNIDSSSPMFDKSSSLHSLSTLKHRACQFFILKISSNPISGWWFQLLWIIWKSVSWDHYSRLNGKIKFMFQTTNQICSAWRHPFVACKSAQRTARHRRLPVPAVQGLNDKDLPHLTVDFWGFLGLNVI